MSIANNPKQSLQLEFAIDGGPSTLPADRGIAPSNGVLTQPDGPPPRSESIVLIDGHNMLQRAAHGYPVTIRNSRGDDVTLLFGFMTLVKASLKSVDRASAIAVVFDGSAGADRRRTQWPGYKPFAPVNDPLEPSLRDIAQLCDTAGVEFIRNNEHEADDVIAAIVSAGTSRRARYFVVSTDHDFYALLADDRVTVVNPLRKPEVRNIRRSEVRQRFGVECERWIDFKSLVGDRADGIPGVRGVGPKRALSLLRDHASMEDLIVAVGDPLLRLWSQLMSFEDVATGRAVSRKIAAAPSYVYRTFPAAEHLLRATGRW